ncbi:hypothetical protein [Glycomyces sp. NPDC048151]|uniref:hypothetical protein n=1 Tax=Glycomyces sp. NPDC048151 TaxID=3364002 RepID=UPI00371B3401
MSDIGENARQESFPMGSVILGRQARRTLATQLRFHYPEIGQVEFEGDSVVLTGGSAGAVGVADLVLRLAKELSSIPDRSPRVRFDSSGEGSVNLSRVDSNALSAAFSGLVTELAEQRTLSPEDSYTDRIGTRTGSGLNLYSHDFSVLCDLLDRFLGNFFQRAYRAQRIAVPSMIRAADVDRAGYFDTARQHISFVSPFDPHPAVYDEFPKFWSQRDPVGSDIADFLSAPEEVLTPAMCLHCFPVLASAAVRSEAPTIITFSGRCFRDEKGNLNQVERLREFTVRENLFIGSEKDLERLHGELADFTIAVAALFGLDFRLETATDIFFGEQASQRTASQMLWDSKFELVAMHEDAPNGVAVASLNQHHSHFTRPFEISLDDGTPALSMCLGFGIERFARAVAAAAGGHGLELIQSHLDRVRILDGVDKSTHHPSLGQE